jgi:hypothetical protein
VNGFPTNTPAPVSGWPAASSKGTAGKQAFAMNPFRSEEHEEWYRSPSQGHGLLTAAGTGWKGRGVDSAPLGGAGMMMRWCLDGYGTGGGLGLSLGVSGSSLMSPSGGVGGLGSSASGSLAVPFAPQTTNGKNATTTGGGLALTRLMAPPTPPLKAKRPGPLLLLTRRRRFRSSTYSEVRRRLLFMYESVD